MTLKWPSILISIKLTVVLTTLVFLWQCKGNSENKDRLRSRSSDSAQMKDSAKDEKDETEEGEDEKKGSEDGGKDSASGAGKSADAGSSEKAFNNAALSSMLSKQKSQGSDQAGECGGSRVLVNEECYSTLEYCAVLNHPPNKYVPDPESKTCRLAPDSCLPYQEVKTVSIKADSGSSKVTQIEVCQDSKTLCTSPNYEWQDITGVPPEELNFQFHGGGRCLMTDEGCKANYAGSSLIEGQNTCTPTPKYCMKTEAEKKFFKGSYENEIFKGECVTEKNFTASAEACEQHEMNFNPAAKKCYHNTQEGCTSVHNIWLSEDQMSGLERLNSSYTEGMTEFEGSTTLLDFYKDVILKDQAAFLEGNALNANVQCQAPSVHTCQLPDNMVFNSSKNICMTSFPVILYMRVKKFDFDFNADCNDPELWWNYDVDSMYIGEFYVNIQSRTTQIDGIKLVLNGLRDKVKFSNNMTHKYYDYNKSFVVEVTDNFTIEVRPEVYRKGATTSLWLNGEKIYKFTEGNNWDMSTSHEEVFEQSFDVNGKSCKARLTFEWRWIQLQ